MDGSHDGYENITHRRQVLFARPTLRTPAYFILIDRISGTGTHTADQYFHFLPAPLIRNSDLREARTALPDGPNLLVRGLRTDGVAMEEVPSEVSFVGDRAWGTQTGPGSLDHRIRAVNALAGTSSWPD